MSASPVQLPLTTDAAEIQQVQVQEQEQQQEQVQELQQEQQLPPPPPAEPQPLPQPQEIVAPTVSSLTKISSGDAPPERKRRSHQKSRKGCVTCKKRKVKCSEEKPVCAQCEKLGLDCQYETRNGVSTAMPLPILECSLMWFWTTETGKGFFSSNVWTADVPRLAFENTYLLHAIFSLAASHQMTLGLDIQSKMAMSVEDFIGRHRLQSLEEFRTVLNVGVTVQNAEALYATAVLLAIQSFTIDSHTWIRMFRGTRFVANELQKVIPQGSIWDQLLAPRPDADVPVPETFVLAPLAQGPLASPISHLARLYSSEEISQEEVFAWPALVDEQFLTLVEADDQAAMVVAFYFYNLLRRVEDQIWWVGQYGRTECERLSTLIAGDFRRLLPADTTEQPTYQ